MNLNPLLKGRRALVTGAGRGLGRSHALELARHGARLLLNDLGADAPDSPCQALAAELRAQGSEVLVHGADVTRMDQVQAMVDQAQQAWGGIDLLVNNAGILRDKSFAKMNLDDFRLVMEVHLMGAVHCTHAVWNGMKERRHGRIVFTTSSSGLYGNFGQSNYSAAKMALVGLMQTLALEGESHNIRVNCLAPTAATGMTEGILPEPALKALVPERVSPGLVALLADDAPTRAILLAGAGSFEAAHITLTRGVHLPGTTCQAEAVLAQWGQIAQRDGETVPSAGWDQYKLELAKAGL